MDRNVRCRVAIAGLLPLSLLSGCGNGDQHTKAPPPLPAVTVVAVAADVPIC